MALQVLFPSKPAAPGHDGGSNSISKNQSAFALTNVRPGDEDNYVREVLARSDGVSEADIERELLAMAESLGIELPNPSALSLSDTTTHHNDHTAASNSSRTSSSPSSDSDKTLVPPHLNRNRPFSTGSDATAFTAITTVVPSHPSRASTALSPTLTETSTGDRRRSRSSSLNFSYYDRYISQLDPMLDQPKLYVNRPTTAKMERLSSSGGRTSGTRGSSRKGVRGLTKSLASKLRLRKSSPSGVAPLPCVCCREDFNPDANTLETLPCGHRYCHDCLIVIISQSIADESKMPPRCCTQPIPSSIIQSILPSDQQQLFLKAVVQYSTPWKARIFCPNTTVCGEFIPPTGKLDPKHPFEVVCPHCDTRVCVMCKRAAHPLGQDCPDDAELEAVLKMGERSGWRRCYKCRTLVELVQGCTHITCRCKAQFCYICGAVWDPQVGCPNFCNGEEEMERRRAEEEARQAALEAERLAQLKAQEEEEARKREAEQRTRESPEFQRLRQQQEAEMARFLAYEQREKAAMRARHAARKQAVLAKYDEQIEKMRERHVRTEQHLEDRQVLAEMELQKAQQEKEKKVLLKLKYMEDYCRGGVTADSPEAQQQQINSDDPDAPPRRIVTARDLEQLREQYCVRDGMQRRHQSQINGLRERQAKAMEELVARHEREMDALLARRDEEVEDLAVGFANEADALEKVFAERRARLVRRWEVAAEILRVEMERKRGVAFGRMEPVVWPAPEPEEGRGEEEKKDEQAEKVEGLADGADGADGADAVSQEEEDNAVGIAK